MAMDQGEMRQLDADALRKRLADAERKYYANLQGLQEQLTRLNAVQALSKLLIGYGDPTGALEKLVELSVRDFGVEKAAILQPRESGYRVAALRGYSRRWTTGWGWTGREPSSSMTPRPPEAS